MVDTRRGAAVHPLNTPGADHRPVVAALYVQADGVYTGLDAVDPWDVGRDARRYSGPWPVVAHPPCNVWCQLASVNHQRWGTPIGVDGGEFAAALHAVRTWGGVLEHPAYSLAWYRHHLPVPIPGGWTQALDDPGISTQVSQSAYGHPARKRTWLYAVGVEPLAMDWSDPIGDRVIGSGVNLGESQGRGRIQPRESSRTPLAFRDALLDLARTCMTMHPTMQPAVHDHA
jgi:hypothetical protein